MRSALAILALGGMMGCGPKPMPVYERRVLFNEADYARFDAGGAGVVDGQAFVKTNGGDVKYCAGEPVILHPLTLYAREWLEHAVMRGERISAADPQLAAHQRRVTADGEGRFHFEGLAAGEYLATCNIRWQIGSICWTPLGWYPCTEENGGVAYGKFSLDEGGTAKVLVTR